ncbi:Acyl-CoA thioesterase [Rhodovastum atsumiense]|uniref:Acyl-CoA thioesterase n=1 Tax=Rhodovastum atsumiense TaxID=504468 RepID=A0A5M6IT85_9PROT|nr:acyl-CoA thioesterase [Rhodovastum atsumiense]KAA5611119.1 acyl-CoA thioesterase [Rhodovastum atsumiense]CAH2599184.1 Acyl-CoA thioesterase [Rhodovastum atsumiense]
MPRIFTRRIVVPAEAIDVFGHVNNLVYLHWMLDVATEHSAAQGWPLERYLEAGFIWVVRSHGITYHRPAFAGDEVALHTWIADFHHHLSTRRYLFRRPADGRVLAEAETGWVLVDRDRLRPRRIPEVLAESFEVVSADEIAALHTAG